MTKNTELIKRVQAELDKTANVLLLFKVAYAQATSNSKKKVILLNEIAKLNKKKKLLQEKLLEYVSA